MDYNDLALGIRMGSKPSTSGGYHLNRVPFHFRIMPVMTNKNEISISIMRRFVLPVFMLPPMKPKSIIIFG